MKPTDLTKKHVISTYIVPARSQGQKTVRIRVGNVQKELGWTNRTPSIYSTLSSREFQDDAGLALIEKVGGPPSGGPSTTVQFVYELLDPAPETAPREKAAQKGLELTDLYGICAGTFKDLGGGEEFLRRERASAPDAWERYQMDQQPRQPGEKAR